MLRRDPNYQRLKLGGRSLLFGGASYWLAKDHLLVVEVVNYVERYRRFYFGDLQAVIVQENGVRRWSNVGLLVALLPILIWLFGTIEKAGQSQWSEPAALASIGVAGTISAVLVAGIVANFLRGRTCSVHLRTAVQTLKLRNVTRRTKADLLLASLTPRVAVAQSAEGSVASGPSAPTCLPDPT